MMNKKYKILFILIGIIVAIVLISEYRKIEKFRISYNDLVFLEIYETERSMLPDGDSIKKYRIKIKKNMLES